MEQNFWYIVSGMFGSILLVILGWLANRLAKIIDRHDKAIIDQAQTIALHEKAIEDLEERVYPVNYKRRK
jgi:hypothetical protein